MDWSVNAKCGVIIPVERGKLAMGTWQRILFFELDGPRHRSISVRVMAD